MNITPDGDYQTYKAESGAYVREHFFGRDPRTRKMVEHHHRRRDLEPQAGRARLPQAVRGVQGGDRAHRTADGHPGQDHQGLDAGLELRGPQRHPPDEEADPQRPQGVPGPALPGHPRLGARGRPVPAAVLPPGREVRRDAVHDGASRGAGRLPAAAAHRRTRSCAIPPTGDVRRHQAGLGQAEGRHHDGVRPPAQGPDEGQEHRRRAGCRSSRTRPARSAWTRCSRPRRSTRRTGSSTRRSTGSCSCPTGRRRPARSCTRASTRPARSRRSPPPAPSYATHDEPMIPLYIFYSMFGFQRTADGLWAAADQMARGFLLGATAGRTTLNGEGLQHEDGHSLLIAATNPAVVAYDPAFALRARLHHRERAAPHVRREAGGHLLLPDRLQRTDPAAGRAGRASTSTGLLQGPLPVRAGARPSTATARGRRSSRPAPACSGRSRRSSCSPRTGAWPPTSGRPRPGPSCAATRSRPRSGTCCTPTQSRGCRT